MITLSLVTEPDLDADDLRVQFISQQLHHRRAVLTDKGHTLGTDGGRQNGADFAQNFFDGCLKTKHTNIAHIR